MVKCGQFFQVYNIFLSTVSDTVGQHFDECSVYKGIDTVMEQLRQTNAFLQHYKPWELVKLPDEKPWVNVLLHVSMETLRVVGIVLQPVVPSLSDRVLCRLNVQPGQRSWTDATKSSHLESNLPLGPDSGLLMSRINVSAKKSAKSQS